MNLISAIPELPPRIKTPDLEGRKNSIGRIGLWKGVNQLPTKSQDILRARVAPERQNSAKILLLPDHTNCAVVWQRQRCVKRGRHVVLRGDQHRSIPGAELLAEVGKLRVRIRSNEGADLDSCCGHEQSGVVVAGVVDVEFDLLPGEFYANVGLGKCGSVGNEGE